MNFKTTVKFGKILNRLLSNYADFLNRLMSKKIVALAILYLCGLTVLQAQTVQITGTVTDAIEDNTLPGVTVLIQGTTSGTTTDIDGEYSISVETGAVLVFSFVGYESQNITVESGGIINVSLSPSVTGLDELVVVGYGAQRAATLTGSITRTDNEVLRNSPTISVSNALAGQLPGLIALNREGRPGSNTSEILIRGQGTMGATAPLVVVDGVPDETGAWQRINSNDIEQISVLKDASASIYGARAANGVILISTKRGTISKPTFEYSFNQGIVQPTKLPEMANSWEWAEFVNYRMVHHQNVDPQFSEADIQTMKDGTDPVRFGNHQWGREIMKDFATQSMHNLSVRGGSEEIRFSVAGSYSNENSIVENGLHDYDGYTIRSNIDAQITDNIGFSLDYNAGIDDIIQPREEVWGIATMPIIPIQWPNGSYSAPPSDNGTNAALNMTGVGGYISDDVRRNSIKASFNIQLPQISNGLEVDGFYTLNNQRTNNRRWQDVWEVYNYDPDTDTYTPRAGGRIAQPDLRVRNNEQQDYLVNLRVAYQTDIDNHSIDSFIGVEQSEGWFESTEAYRRDFLSSQIDQLFAGARSNMEADGYRSETARQNIFGRIRYNYKEKYLIDTNLRYDGSFAFPKGNRWGFFPGVSAAWRMNQEDFLSDRQSISDLKLRVSYGQMGNDQINPFQFLSLNTLDGAGTHFGSPRGTQPILIPGVSPNEDITWEVATTANIGLDGLFWEGLFGFTLDLFQENRSNILTARDTEVPIYTGIVLPDENIGETENKGIELLLSHRGEPSSDWSYFVSGNVAYVKNKVIDISEPADLLPHQKAEGKAIGAGLYYEAIGIFRTQEEVDAAPKTSGTRVGDLQYRDINGDGQITADDRVRMDRGPIPELTFGLNANINYKNFSLYGHLAGQARAWVYHHQNARIGLNGLRDLIVNRYTPGSMDSKYPNIPQESRPDAGDVSGLMSDFWLQNASFLRLKTLRLGYTLPTDILSRFGLSSMEVYVNANNLFTLAYMDWFDPEAAHSQAQTGGTGLPPWSRGNFYPQVKVFNAGFNITF